MGSLLQDIWGGMLLEQEAMPPSHPAEIPHAGLAPVAQAPAQSSVWGSFIWGQTSLISQLGPASDQRAAFISQCSGQPPAPGAPRPSPRSQNIPAVGKSQQHLQDASASWALPQPQSVSWGHVLLCTRWELQGVHGDVCGVCRVALFSSQINILVQNTSSHMEHPTGTAKMSFLSPARGSFALFFPRGSECVPAVHTSVRDVLTH